MISLICVFFSSLSSSLISGQWGYCSPDCTGQLPRFDSAYNIANNPQFFQAKIVIAVDVDEDKLKTAVKFGATHTLLANKETSNLIRQV